MNWLTQPLERVFLRPLRSLGGLSFDVVVSEEHEDTLTIAKHPVEQGANISDHAYRNPCKVVIRGASSESTYGLPVWDPYNATLYNALLALQNAREPFDIVTGKRKYGNMLRLRGQGNDITHCRTHYGCIFKAMQNVTSRGRPASGPCSPSRRSWRGSGACRVRPGPPSPASSR